ncbi:bactericidal permeability-increasing protein-like [Astyanax mexicanus]|uniref:Bactericidal permeability-increasing protein n=1 Tax=Astyanax mexicanus TaxID=7994 RepID=A0A8B9KPW6_ASTMX|nr:bactericidal permeability-increasing protein-like [Astyanax mexicanus]
MVKMWLIGLVLMNIMNTHAEYSALQAVLSQKGLEKVAHWSTDWLQNELSSIELPEVRGGVNIGIGTVHYVLHDMSIQRCDLPEPSVAFSEGTGVSLQVSGLSIAISGHWNTQFGVIHDSGWFEIAVYTVNLNTVLQLGSDEERLSISTIMCSADVGSVQVNFHGGASFIFQPFVDIFSGQIANEIRVQICPALEKGIDVLERHLAAVPVALKVDPYVFMNISLTDSPLVEDSGLGLNVTGEFYSISSPSEPPFSPDYFDLTWQENFMMSLGASEFCVNSAAYAYHTAGALQIRITEDMIPKASPFHLNTSAFGSLIPQLPKQYPDMPMELQLYTSETPLISFSKTVTSVRLLASVKAFAVKPDSGTVPLFRLDIESSFSAKAYIEKVLVKGALEMKNLTVTLGATEIGQFSITPIERALTLGMKAFVLPKVNAQLSEGIQLPFVKGFGLKNAVMAIEDGFVAVAADISGPDDNTQ